MGYRAWTPHLEDEFVAQLLLLGLDRVVQLQQTPLPQSVIGRPIRFIEGAPRRVDGPVHVVLRRVGDLTQWFLGSGVYVGEGPCLAVDELAVDHHLGLEPNVSHGSRSLASAGLVLPWLRPANPEGRRIVVFPAAAASCDACPHPAVAGWRSTAFARRGRPDAGRTAPSPPVPWLARPRTCPAIWRHVASWRARVCPSCCGAAHRDRPDRGYLWRPRR